jgi:hypothetical protein
MSAGMQTLCWSRNHTQHSAAVQLHNLSLFSYLISKHKAIKKRTFHLSERGLEDILFEEIYCKLYLPNLYTRNTNAACQVKERVYGIILHKFVSARRRSAIYNPNLSLSLLACFDASEQP